MVVNKRKKNSRSRGLHTHFYGSKKKHRGAGHRGGRGNAGSGKKADQKKPSFWADTKYFGRYGFKSKNIIDINPISLKDVSMHLNEWVILGIAKKEGQKFRVNLEELGYNKLLSNGKAPSNCTITVPYASEKAIEKVSRAGGSVEGIVEKKQKEDSGSSDA